jgi:hypothetical protein
VFSLGGDISEFVPPAVLRAMKRLDGNRLRLKTKPKAKGLTTQSVRGRKL